MLLSYTIGKGSLGRSLNRRVQGEGHFLLRVLRGGMPLSGVSKERVTLWSGCTGLTVLAGFSGQRPEWDGATPSPSGEPTTSERSGEVIVGYIRASPCHPRHDNGVPLKAASSVINPSCL